MDGDYDDYQQKINLSRAEGIPDSLSFEKMKALPEVQAKYAEAQKNGINSREMDKFVIEKYQLDTRAGKTILQQAMSTLAQNPLAELVEAAAGRNPVSESLRDVSKAVTTTIPAAIASAPREIAHLPENIMNASEQYHKERPEESGLLKSIADPVLGAADWIMDNLGIKEASKAFPTFEQALGWVQAEEDQPKSHVGKLAQRVTGGATLAGPLGAVIGAADYVGENVLDMSPEQRALMSLFIRPTSQNKPTKTLYGEILPKEPITSPNGLAARLIAYDTKNINTPVVKAAYELNMPIEKIPMQALYKNGLPNVLEGVAQNSVIGSYRFKELLEDFTTEMTARTNEIIDSMPMDIGADKITSTTELGQPLFKNAWPETLQIQAPQLEIAKYQTGSIGKNAMQAYGEEITNKYKDLYDQVTFNNNDLLRPSMSDYDSLQTKINEVQKKLSSKGFKGSERREALGVLSDINSLFKLKETLHPVTGDIIKEKPNIKLEHIRKNIQDLNKTISYEHPSLVNLLSPIANEMRSIMDRAAQGKEHLFPLLEANALFREKAQFFNDPIMEKLNKMTDEQFYTAVRKKPTYLKKFIEFAEKTGQEQSLNDLKGQIMADVMEKTLKASSPKELVSSITDGLIRETRELEPFFPELKGLSKSLENSRKWAREFMMPQEMFKGKIRQQILEDVMSDSGFTSTLKTMNSPQGIDLVNNTLNNTPQGKSLYKSLVKKKVEECLYKGPRKQEIDLSEMSQAFQNPVTDAILKKLLPLENYKQAKNLAKIAGEYVTGAEQHKNIKHKFETGVGLGLVASAFVSPLSTVFGVSTFAYFLTSKNFKKAMVDVIKSDYKKTKQKPPPFRK